MRNIKRFSSKFRLLIAITIMAGMFHSCKEVTKVLEQLNMKEPNASVKNVKITNLSLQKADLLFDIAVENPNAVGIELEGIDYDLLINGASFLKGQKEDKLQLAANGSSTIQIPLSLSYSEVHKAIKSFVDLDTIPYQLNLKIGVTLPVLGAIKVPVTKKGSFPNLQLPSIRLDAIKLDKIGLTSADLNFKIHIKNPNALNFITNNLNYNLDVNGKNWVSGLLDQPVQIKKKSAQTVSIPVSLNFLEMGAAVYQLLTGDSKLEYHLSGNAAFKSDLKLLDTFSLPFDKSGKIDLTK